LDRRKFIALSSIVAGYPAIAKSFGNEGLITAPDSTQVNLSASSPIPVQIPVLTDISNYAPIIPPALTKGSKVAITSPSSTTNVWELSATIKVLKGLGLEVILGKTVTNQKNNFRYLAAPDKERADEFNAFVRDKEIKGIIASRGGYGTMRMIDFLDFDAIRENPKIYIGFSDFTFILNSISKLCNLVTYHGPVGISTFTSMTKEYFVKTLFEGNSGTFTIKPNNLTVLNDGIAEGKLIGGNLTLLASSLGTKYEFDSTDSILFIEEVSEHAYQMDRLLNQLKLAGKFDKVKGIILGQFKNLNTRRPFYPNNGYTIMEVIQQVIVPLKVPTVLNFPIGHISEQVTLPLLANSVLNAKEKTLQIHNRH
jgi:muramoyltetrapeptide carboxypeptidase